MPKGPGIVGDRLAPYFNEAHANQMALLSRELRAPVLTCHDLGLLPWKRRGRYFIVNSRFLERGTPFLAQLTGALLYLALRRFQRAHGVLFLPSGLDSRFFPYLPLERCILVMNALTGVNREETAARFAQRVAPRLLGILAQSQRVRERLLELGVAPEKVHFAYPWVDLDLFRALPPPPEPEFRLLFASAPNWEDPREDLFAAKGVGLLLEAFALFLRQVPQASLALVWRGHYDRVLYDKMKGLGLGDRVAVAHGVAPMPSIYARCHATVIPFQSPQRSPQVPLSAAESLACGRPVVTTDVVEMAQIVTKYGCGPVSPPLPEPLAQAFLQCYQDYSRYQSSCRLTAEKLFDSGKIRSIMEKTLWLKAN